MQAPLPAQQTKPPESYLVAHDVRDGHVKWNTPRVSKADAEGMMKKLEAEGAKVTLK